MKLKILDENQDYLTIDKPPGIHSVKSPNSNETSVADFIGQQLPQYASSSPKPEDCGLVNRLDFETSGCLILAKTKTTWEKLHRKFTCGKVEKSYEALITGKLTNTVTIKSWIGTPNRNAKKVKSYSLEPAKNCRAQYAESEFIPVKYNEPDNTTLVQVKTATGRRHQVRIHAREIGHPLKGDLTYQTTASGNNELKNSFYLRCTKITFSDD